MTFLINNYVILCYDLILISEICRIKRKISFGFGNTNREDAARVLIENGTQFVCSRFQLFYIIFE